MKSKVEWHRGSDFAEYAEALGIRTAQIMLARVGEKTLVVYTPETDENNLDPNTPLVGATLARDPDGILRTVGEPVLMEGFDWDALNASIAARLEERYG